MSGGKRLANAAMGFVKILRREYGDCVCFSSHTGKFVNNREPPTDYFIISLESYYTEIPAIQRNTVQANVLTLRTKIASRFVSRRFMLYFYFVCADINFMEETITMRAWKREMQQDDEKRIPNLSSNVCLADHDLNQRNETLMKEKNYYIRFFEISSRVNPALYIVTTSGHLNKKLHPMRNVTE